MAPPACTDTRLVESINATLSRRHIETDGALWLAGGHWHVRRIGGASVRTTDALNMER